MYEAASTRLPTTSDSHHAPHLYTMHVLPRHLTDAPFIVGTHAAGKMPGDLASTYKRDYSHGLRRPFGLSSAVKNPGLRSEEMITVGQYTAVLRTGSTNAGYTAG